jgi:hypothetical protein
VAVGVDFVKSVVKETVTNTTSTYSTEVLRLSETFQLDADFS